MAKIERKTQQIFAGQSGVEEKAIMGTMKTGAPVYSEDIAALQDSPAYNQGWQDAIIEGKNPFLEEFNGVNYINTSQLAYLFQQGIPEWDAGTTYYMNSFCQVEGTLYKSITDENTGNNPSADVGNWTEFKLGGGGGGSGLSIFDLIQKDHELTFEESKGFAPLGSYVYSEGVEGSRYGYPDFYAKCVEEMQNANELYSLKDNVVKNGNVEINNGIVSGFAAGTYALIPGDFSPGTSTWEIVAKFTTGSDMANQGVLSTLGAANSCTPVYLVGGQWRLYLSSGSGWDIASSVAIADLSPLTTYKVKVEFTGTQYVSSMWEDGEWVVKNTITNSTGIAGGIPIQIGTNRGNGNPFTGTFDLKESYINIDGQRWWTGADVIQQNANGHAFYDIADKAMIDSIYEESGIAWCYGVDTVNERIFLPRNDFKKLVKDTYHPVMGNGLAFALTDGTYSASTAYVSGVGYQNGSDIGAVVGSSRAATSMTSNKNIGVPTEVQLGSNLENSGLIAKLNSQNPMQYWYMVVGNTEITSAATEVTQVTTTENDTIPLFTPHYFNFDVNNPSWLKAGQQQNSGGIYQSAYNELVNILNGTSQNNLKVIDESQMVSGVDYSTYWIVNQTSMYFKTPTKLENQGQFLNGEIPVMGNGITLAFSDGTNLAGIFKDGTTSATVGIMTGSFGTQIGSAFAGGVTPNLNTSLGVPTKEQLGANLENSGLIALADPQVPAGWNLYFKVANAVENIQLLDAGEVLNVLASKLDEGNKEQIISWGIPDYTAGVSVSTSFTAPSAGFVTYELTTTTGGVATVNNVTVLNKVVESNYDYARMTQSFYCDKGDVVSIPVSGMFYPLKGAINA